MSAAAPSANIDHGSHAGHHITPQWKLMLTFAELLFWMVATIAAANFMPEPLKSDSTVMNVIAMGIAIRKAYIVISIFMGVKWASKLTKLFAIGGFVWFFLLFIALTDYASRQWEPVNGWEKYSPNALPRDPERPEINQRDTLGRMSEQKNDAVMVGDSN